MSQRRAIGTFSESLSNLQLAGFAEMIAIDRKRNSQREHFRSPLTYQNDPCSFRDGFQEPVIVGVGSKNNKGVLISGLFVGLQGLEKCVEGRILTVSVSIDPGRLVICFSADLLRSELLFHAAHSAQGLEQLVATPQTADQLGGQSFIQE